MKKPDKKNIQDIFALTPIQEGMLFHYLKDPEKEVYCEQLCLEIKGPLDIKTFEQAWNIVIDTNEMLRTLFRWNKMEQPVQLILKKYHLKTRYNDFSNKPNQEKRISLEELLLKDRKEGFDLREVPLRVTLAKVAEKKVYMILSHHHILYDGWSGGIILEEFFRAYNDLLPGKSPTQPGKTKFIEFIKWLQEQDTGKEEEFWKKYLKGFDTPLGLSIKQKRKTDKISIGMYQAGFEKEIVSKSGTFIKKHKITLASLLYTAWGLLLQRYNNSNDVIFGTTVSGRTAGIKSIEEIVGLFINTLPLRVQNSPGEETTNLLYSIYKALQIREPFDYTSPVNIKAYSEINSNEELFDTVMVVENYPLSSRLEANTGLLSPCLYSIVEMPHYDLTISITAPGKPGKDMRVNILYQRELFDNQDIERLFHHLASILQDIIENPQKKAVDLEILSELERSQLLVDFNQTDVQYPTNKTIPQLFAEQEKKTPDCTALVGSWQRAVPGKRTIHLTYRQLNKKSHQLSQWLREKGVGPGTIVSIMMERSIELIIGILGILKAGGIYLPIDRDNPGDRIKYMLTDSRVHVMVTSITLAKEIKKLKSLEVMRKLETIFIDSIEFSNFSSSHLPHLTTSPASLAYIIYTSGSTGNPKGVPISYSNLCPLLYWGYGLQLGLNDRTIQNLSYFFDWSVWEIFITLTIGAGLYMVEDEVQRNPVECIDFIQKHALTVLHITPTQFQYFLNGEGSLKTLKYLFLGAEKLTIDLAKRSFEAVSKDCRVFNMYGPTEDTIIAAVSEIDRTWIETFAGLSSVPIGGPIANTSLFVLNRYLKLCPVNITGELYLGGDGVARGYLNNPELTAEKFDHDLWDYQDYHDENKKFCGGVQMLHGAVFQKSPPGRRRPKIYKTGDLARWLPHGIIEFLGRVDFQVKIRGFRIELGEIEKHLLNHKGVKEAVVTTWQEEDGTHALAAYIVPEPEYAPAGKDLINELRTFLKEKTPGYMVPSYFMLLSKIPLNANRKLDRKALPRPEIKVNCLDRDAYTAPGNKIEQKLVKLWAENLNIPKEIIGIDSNFFELGGHSLKAARLINQIHKIFDTEIPISELFNTPTVKALADYIHKIEKTGCCKITSTEKKEYYCLSSAQQRLFVLQQLGLNSTVYHISDMMILEGNVEKEKFEQSFKKLIHRHECLRTSFQILNNEPTQWIQHEAEFKIEYHDISEVQVEIEAKEKGRLFGQISDTFGKDLAKEDTKEENDKLQITSKKERSSTAQYSDPKSPELRAKSYIYSFIRPFDLSQTPLLRVGLIKISEKKQLLLFDMHHIIADGITMAILIKELVYLYNGKHEDLPPLPLQYRDYSEWQNRVLQSKEMKKQEHYWLDQFKDGVNHLELPFNSNRDSMKHPYTGNSIVFYIDSQLTQRINAAASETGTTLYMLFLAVLNILLSRYARQPDIVVGTPVAGRKHPDLEHIAGIFINTLAIRIRQEINITFETFLEHVKHQVLNAFENQDYPFDKLVETLNIPKKTGRNPLFDMMLVPENVDIPGLELEGLKCTPVKFEKKIAHQHLVVYVTQLKNNMEMQWEYTADLFKRTDIENMAAHFREILEQVLTDRTMPLEKIQLSHDLLVPAEKNPAMELAF